MFEAYVRARTADNRWASVAVHQLDEQSFRRLVADKLVATGILMGLEVEDVPYTTPLTKAQAEGEEE